MSRKCAFKQKEQSWVNFNVAKERQFLAKMQRTESGESQRIHSESLEFQTFAAVAPLCVFRLSVLRAFARNFI